ncbi:RND family efflux transporter MFP subunit [Mucilaginibacter yixingensis]|uniref:RND family efflux transporter MFP subunit n=2 Tax=Mucilaginibacter yixingensis TaxID=1295612 RepID=A0A2T5J7J4_9SPHI|nr:RND family efflux transporter MFP subunit [Mucilaginibacter yixingensis]
MAASNNPQSSTSHKHINMKKILYIAPLLLLAACGPKPAANNKEQAKAELEKLKKQQTELNEKIAKLQAQIGAGDSSKVTDVSTLAVKSQSFTNYVQIQGSIDAQDNVTAYPQAAGTITAINVKVGQHVGRGQVLAQLDNSVLRQQIAQGEAQLSLAATVYQRQKALWDQKIGTEVQYLQAKSNYEAGQKQLAAAKEQAAMYTIKSPINGTVDQMDLKLGQVAQPGQTGIRIVNADNLKVKANVPESYSGRINAGDKVKVLVPDAADSVMATVTFAAKVIDPASRSFAIEVKLPGRKTLRPNMTAVLKIADYNAPKAIAIPVNAIQRSENGSFVFVDQNATAKRVAVTLGATYGGLTEVKTGLNGGEQLITMGASEVEDGDKIKVIQAVN